MGQVVDQLIASGYGGYAGWGDAEAAADFNAGHGDGKKTGGAGGKGGGGSFNFDYTGEAQKAYGELGTYYDRLFKDYKGDMNKILARLVEDYATGVRLKRTSTAEAQTAQDFQQGQAVDRTTGALINRGLLSTSAYAPPPTNAQPGQQGYGTGDTIFTNLLTPFKAKTTTRAANLADYETRYGENGTLLTRKRADTTQSIDEKQFALEQQRREQAATMADQRASRAYNSYLASRSTF